MCRAVHVHVIVSSTCGGNEMLLQCGNFNENSMPSLQTAIGEFRTCMIIQSRRRDRLVCVCVCITCTSGVCVCRGEHIHICVWRPEVNIVSISVTLHLSFETGIPRTWSSSVQVGSLASELRDVSARWCQDQRSCYCDWLLDTCVRACVCIYAYAIKKTLSYLLQKTDICYIKCFKKKTIELFHGVH